MSRTKGGDSKSPVLQATPHGFMLFGSASIDSPMKFQAILQSHRLDVASVFALATECVPALRTLGVKLKHEKGAEYAASSIEKALKSNPENQILRARDVLDTCIRVYTKEDADVGFIYREVNKLLRNAQSMSEFSIKALSKIIRDACGDLGAYALLLWEGLKLMFAPTAVSKTLDIVKLFRGLRLPVSAYKALCAQEDRFIVLPGFTSFSLELESAMRFPCAGAPADRGKEVDVILELDVFSRPVIEDMANPAYKHEREVVLHPFSAFKVITSASAGPGGRPVVRLCHIEVVCSKHALAPTPPASTGSGFAIVSSRLSHVKNGDTHRAILARKDRILAAAAAGDWRSTMALFNDVPAVKALYDGSAMVAEGYTVGEHTIRVLMQFDAQKGFFKLNEVQAEMRRLGSFQSFDAVQFMVILLLLHDIGKSLGDNPTEQHVYTLPAMEVVMEQLHFLESEVNLAKLLVGNDILGDWEKTGEDGPETSAMHVVKRIQELSRQAGVPEKVFFRMQKALYICDSSSYPTVLNGYITQSDTGRLNFRPKDGEIVGRLTFIIAFFEGLKS